MEAHGRRHCGEHAAPRTGCRDLAAVLTDVMVALARERAADGQVSIGDIERIATLVAQGNLLLDETFSRQQEACRKEHTRPRGNIGARSNPFQRLMVRPFEHLLAGESAVFQRVYLAHYFEFLDYAFEEKLSKFEAHCRSIVQALKVVHGPHLTWDHFYADQRTIKTLHTALKVLSAYLAGMEGQRVWLATLIRPTPEMPQPSMAQVEQIRKTLMDTARGFEAADRLVKEARPGEPG